MNRLVCSSTQLLQIAPESSSPLSSVVVFDLRVSVVVDGQADQLIFALRDHKSKSALITSVYSLETQALNIYITGGGWYSATPSRVCGLASINLSAYLDSYHPLHCQVGHWTKVIVEIVPLPPYLQEQRAVISCRIWINGSVNHPRSHYAVSTDDHWAVYSAAKSDLNLCSAEESRTGHDGSSRSMELTNLVWIRSLTGGGGVIQHQSGYYVHYIASTNS